MHQISQLSQRPWGRNHPKAHQPNEHKMESRCFFWQSTFLCHPDTRWGKEGCFGLAFCGTSRRPMNEYGVQSEDCFTPTTVCGGGGGHLTAPKLRSGRVGKAAGFIAELSFAFLPGFPVFCETRKAVAQKPSEQRQSTTIHGLQIRRATCPRTVQHWGAGVSPGSGLSNSQQCSPGRCALLPRPPTHPPPPSVRPH